jgi:hypothetical protein
MALTPKCVICMVPNTDRIYIGFHGDTGKGGRVDLDREVSPQDPQYPHLAQAIKNGRREVPLSSLRTT